MQPEEIKMKPRSRLEISKAERTPGTVPNLFKKQRFEEVTTSAGIGSPSSTDINDEKAEDHEDDADSDSITEDSSSEEDEDAVDNKKQEKADRVKSKSPENSTIRY